jgi:[acyl-carrier-protein] S-malonyltransferase
MKPAVEPVRELATSIETHSVSQPVISNKDGRVVTTASEVLHRIVEQIASPVRWDLCMETMKSIGITGVIELPPAGTLVGLLKRAASEIETFALKSADDLDAAREFAGRHA